MLYNRILCIGDSITFGSRDTKASTYPLEMEGILEKTVGGAWVCLNYGICGETTVDIVKHRFYETVHKHDKIPEICFFEGFNDAKDPGTPIETYRKNIEHCIKVALSDGRKLFLGTIPSHTGPLAPDYSARCNERIHQYNPEVRALSQDSRYKGGVILVELEDIDKSHYADGVHLKNEGHVEIAKRFANAILLDRGYKND